MKIKCTHCKREFETSAKQNRLIDSIRAKGGTFAMVECPLCYSTFGVDFGAEPQPEDDPFRCPVSGCSGWVSWVALKGEEPFFGCGECGSIWRKEGSLFRDISAAVERYPYRLKSYRKKGMGWAPGDPDKEAKNYEDKVEKEPVEFGDDFDKT